MTDDAANLYFRLDGAAVGPHIQYFIDKDNSGATGYQGNGNWASCGADYMIEDGTLRVRNTNTNDNTWSWTDVGTVATSVSGGVATVTVPKSAISGLGNTIRVGAWDSDAAWALKSAIPVKTKALATYVLTAAGAPIEREAEAYTSKSSGLSVQTTDVAASGGAYVGWSNNNDYLVFNGIDLTNVTNVRVRTATANSGCTLEFRAGSLTGTLLATVNIPNSGGWAASNTWAETMADLSGAAGVQNVYVVFKTGGTNGVADLDWIRFHTAAVTKEADTYSAKTSGLNVLTATGLGATGDTYVGWSNNNDYLAFNGIDLSGIKYVQVRTATPNTGCTLELRLGSATGTLIGTVNLPNSGGWAGAGYWANTTVALSAATGTQNVYVVFKTSGTNGVTDLDWLKFIK